MALRTAEADGGRRRRRGPDTECVTHIHNYCLGQNDGYAHVCRVHAYMHKHASTHTALEHLGSKAAVGRDAAEVQQHHEGHAQAGAPAAGPLFARGAFNSGEELRTCTGGLAEEPTPVPAKHSDLGPVLEAIWSCCAPRAIKVHLMQRAVQSAMSSPAAQAQQADQGSGTLYLYEASLDAAAVAVGGPTGIGKVQALLRDRGAKTVSRRLNAVSKARRTVAHPDVRLPADIVEALSGEVFGDETRLLSETKGLSAVFDIEKPVVGGIVDYGVKTDGGVNEFYNVEVADAMAQTDFAEPVTQSTCGQTFSPCSTPLVPTSVDEDGDDDSAGDQCMPAIPAFPFSALQASESIFSGTASCDGYVFGVRELCSVAERLWTNHDGQVPMALLVEEAVEPGFDADAQALRDLLFSQEFKVKFALGKRGFLRKRAL